MFQSLSWEETICPQSSSSTDNHTKSFRGRKPKIRRLENEGSVNEEKNGHQASQIINPVGPTVAHVDMTKTDNKTLHHAITSWDFVFGDCGFSGKILTVESFHDDMSDVTSLSSYDSLPLTLAMRVARLMGSTPLNDTPYKVKQKEAIK